MFVQQLLGRHFHKSTRVERVVAVHLLAPLVAGETNLAGIDNIDEVTGVHVENDRDVLTAKHRGDLGRGATEGLALEVDDPPLALCVTASLVSRVISVAFA